jgi:hypothetical protein
MTTEAPILWGAKGIAEFLKLTPRQVNHMIETKQIIVGKKNGRLCITKTDLLEQFRLELIRRQQREPRA